MRTSLQITAFSKQLNTNFNCIITSLWSVHSGYGEIQIMGKNITCELKRNTGNYYVMFKKADLPSAFLKELSIPKNNKELGFVVEDQAFVKEQIEQLFATEKAEKEAKQNELKEQAKQYTPNGWAYDVGCDTSDSNYFIFPENTPKELKPYITTPSTNLVSKWVKWDDLKQQIEKGNRIGELPGRAYSYGTHIFSMAAFVELAAIAQTREDKLIAAEKVAIADVEAEENRIKTLAQGKTVINVLCESKPHCNDLSGKLLNSPAPQSGNFLVNYRVSGEVWAKMKAQGASYYDEEFLEDMDMFGMSPGWRYSLAAVSELIIAGFAVKIGREVFITVAELFSFYGISTITVSVEKAELKEEKIKTQPTQPTLPESKNKTYRITGNTYPVKEKLAKLGCIWNKTVKAWETTNIKIAREAQEYVFLQQYGDASIAEEMAEEALGI